MKVMSIAGARPNFVKLAAIANAIGKYNFLLNTGEKQVSQPSKIDHIIVHTGQHYDTKMSQVFFDELDIPRPNINLEVGSASHASQTAQIMIKFESVLMREKPDVLLVVGDVNSTIACTLVASKIQYTAQASVRRPLLVHVEAGLRSFDRRMPEEINRILTDNLCDLLFVTEDSGIENLKNEGIDEKKIHFVGNIMIDTLLRFLPKADQSRIKEKLNINSKYILSTLHRPSNVDSFNTLEPLIKCLLEISRHKTLVFPLHPRTKNILKYTELYNELHENSNIILTEPLGYLDFLNLLKGSELVITDSGGIQEETTFLGIPCITLRDNTERPVTVRDGSNYLVGTNPEKILEAVRIIFSGQGKQVKRPKYWDGLAGDRIIKAIVERVQKGDNE